MFENIVKKDQLHLTMDSPMEPESFAEYLEGWRIRVWDHAFITHFRGNDVFRKSDDFKKHKGGDLVVKRVIYRYVL
jgi:hypothetical protein